MGATFPGTYYGRDAMPGIFHIINLNFTNEAMNFHT